MTTIIILSIIGAVISAVIGTVWYSNKTPMGRTHMTYLGFDKLSPEEQQRKIAEAKPKMPKIYFAQMILSFLSAFWVVFVVTTSIKNGMSALYAYVFVLSAWLCFVVPMVGTGILWGTCDPKIAWKKFFSDIFSNLLTLLVIAFLATLFV
jgi:hypothetical protein